MMVRARVVVVSRLGDSGRRVGAGADGPGPPDGMGVKVDVIPMFGRWVQM